MKDTAEDNIPTLTEVVESNDKTSSSEDVTEFDFNGLTSDSKLSKNDVMNLQKALNEQLKLKIKKHSENLYKELASEINQNLKKLLK